MALKRGLGYLHACGDFPCGNLPATSRELVYRQASEPSLPSAIERGFWSDDDFDTTVEKTQTDMESGQLDRSDSQRPSAQFLLADAVISTEMRLTTRELPPERTAGPYSPDSHCQSGLLECATARVSWAMQCFVYTNLSRFMGAMYSNGTHETSDVPRSEISGHHVIMRLVPKERNVNLAFL